MGIITRSIANNIVTGGKLDGTDGLSGVISASNIADASITNVTAFSSSLGDAIESVATDPVSPSEGQLWYNNTIGVLKGYQLVADAWASGGNLTSAKYGMGGAGIQTAALAFGGGSPNTNVTQEYDGSSWTAGPSPSIGNLNITRGEMMGCGTQTAALGFGGYVSPANTTSTEKYDGTTWTTSGSMPAATRTAGAAGTQTAALGFGGYTTSPTGTTNAISFNGTTWSPITSLPSNRNGPAGFGIQTAAISAGGRTSTTDLANTEEWNGSAWTAGGNLGTARYQFAGSGVESAGLVFGGFSGPAVTGSTELYNGTSWTNTASMATARRIIGSSTAAPNSASLVFGGLAPATSNATEEFTGAFLSVKKVTLT